MHAKPSTRPPPRVHPPTLPARPTRCCACRARPPPPSALPAAFDKLLTLQPGDEVLAKLIVPGVQNAQYPGSPIIAVTRVPEGQTAAEALEAMPQEVEQEDDDEDEEAAVDQRAAAPASPRSPLMRYALPVPQAVRKPRSRGEAFTRAFGAGKGRQSFRWLDAAQTREAAALPTRARCSEALCRVAQPPIATSTRISRRLQAHSFVHHHPGCRDGEDCDLEQPARRQPDPARCAPSAAQRCPARRACRRVCPSAASPPAQTHNCLLPAGAEREFSTLSHGDVFADLVSEDSAVRLKRVTRHLRCKGARAR